MVRVVTGLAVAALSASLLTAAPAVAAQTLVLRGTNIGGVPTDSEYLGLVGSVVNGVLPEGSPGDFPAVAPGIADLVDYPASFWPVSTGGFKDPKWNKSVSIGRNNVAAAAASDDDLLIFGYSQGAVVASQFKAATPSPAHDVTYVLLGNPNRPNGGFLERFYGITIPILDVTATGATPPDGGTTYDVGLQYDGWSDFPRYPADLLATFNAIAGIVYLHGFANQQAQIDVEDLVDPAKTDIVVDGETTYFTVPTQRLPILIPFEGIIPSPILTALDAPLRVIVEWGYDRSVSPGAPKHALLIPVGNPIRDVVNLLKAIPIGIDDGLAEAAGDPGHRPFGTTPAGMYGVGGRDLSPQSVTHAGPASRRKPQPQTQGRQTHSAKPTVRAKAASSSRATGRPGR